MSAFNQVVAISNAKAGAGEAAARLLGAKGANLLLGTCATQSQVRQLAAEIRAAGGAAECKKVDVTCRASMENFIGTAYDRFGRLDVFIENTGWTPSLENNDQERLIDSKIKGILYGITAALSHMPPKAALHTISVATFGGNVLLPSVAVYFAAKLAVPQFSGTRSSEHWPEIRVTVISPRANPPPVVHNGSRPESAMTRKALRLMTVEVQTIAQDILHALNRRRGINVSHIGISKGRMLLSPVQRKQSTDTETYGAI
jgi:NADP-dependent 3-hydroxy acid dehydrogenase YdfG